MKIVNFHLKCLEASVKMSMFCCWRSVDFLVWCHHHFSFFLHIAPFPLYTFSHRCHCQHSQLCSNSLVHVHERFPLLPSSSPAAAVLTESIRVFTRHKELSHLVSSCSICICYDDIVVPPSPSSSSLHVGISSGVIRLLQTLLKLKQPSIYMLFMLFFSVSVVQKIIEFWENGEWKGVY